jgi:amino acid transporter
MAAGAIYLAVTLVASMVVPVDRLASSSAPLLEVTSVGPLAVPDRLFSAIALFALANGALINLIMASRLMYGMAEQGVVPGVLGRVLPKRGTPWVAIVNVAVLVLRRDPVDFKHFRSPTAMPVIGFIVSIGLMTTKDGEVFLRAGILIGVGALLWVVTRLIQGHRR